MAEYKEHAPLAELVLRSTKLDERLEFNGK